MIYRHLSVDNKRDNKITEIITQKEHGVTLFKIKCLNGAYDIDLTECTQAQFYGEKPDSHKVGVKCDFNEDKTAVLLPLILQMTTARAEPLYLGISDSIDNYKEIDKNTPIPIPDVGNNISNNTDGISEKQLLIIKEVLGDA
jgi:hypothetical protein